MEIVNRNLIIASNLYRASAFVSAVVYFLFEPRPGLMVEFPGLVITILIAYLIRQGFNWVKWFLLILTVVFVPFYIIAFWGLFKENVFSALTSVTICFLQTLAVVYLFLPYKEPEFDETEV